ncbi:hypothetical protein F9K88_07365 [Brucella intermedia]|nr:hypothetical protein F9K88_07365 [Brucella intermedia]
MPDGAGVTAQTTMLIELLGNGVLSNIASVPVEEGKVLVGNVAGQYEAKDYVGDPNGSLGKLAALTLAARQILQTDATGALKTIALAANKVLNTDANADILLSDVTQYGRTVLAAANEASARTIIGANRPMFSATASSDISISNGNNTNIPLTNVTVNVGNNWNGTRFLCPEAGNYFFSFIAQWNGGGDNTGYGIARLKKNGAFTGTAVAASKTLFYVPVCVQGILPLAFGDTVNFDFELVGASGTIVLQTANTRGTGFLLR